MLYGFVLVVHVLVCLVLIGVVLLQGGRGGLSEAMGGAAAQSLFGSGAATVLTRATTFCAGLFVITCLSLAYLSTTRGHSVMDQVPMTLPEALPAGSLPLPTAPIQKPQAVEPAAPASGSTAPAPANSVTAP